MERHSFCIVSGESPELCGNYTFLQKFQTRKLSEITVFYAVYPTSILRLIRPLLVAHIIISIIKELKILPDYVLD